MATGFEYRVAAVWTHCWELMAKHLFDPSTVGRVAFFWMLSPILSATTSYAQFASGVT